MGFFQRLRERYQSARLEADVRYGRKTWGRQPPRGRAIIEAKVIRADGRVEDLGVIAEVDVDFEPGVGR